VNNGGAGAYGGLAYSSSSCPLVIEVVTVIVALMVLDIGVCRMAVLVSSDSGLLSGSDCQTVGGSGVCVQLADSCSASSKSSAICSNGDLVGGVSNIGSYRSYCARSWSLSTSSSHWVGLE
jgi:hypothetical protein